MVVDRPDVRIPTRAVPTMRLLASLDETQQGNLEAAFSQTPASSSVDELRTRVRAVLDADEPDETAGRIVGEVFGLASLAVSHNYSMQGLAESVAAAPQLDLEDDNRASFAEFFRRLLVSPAVKTIGKATDLAGEYERTAHTVRVVAELVPVFDEPDNEPVGAVLMHRLRLTYWKNAKVEEIDIAFDSDQLKELGKAVARAEAKARSLEQMLVRIDLPSFQMSAAEESHG